MQKVKVIIPVKKTVETKIGPVVVRVAFSVNTDATGKGPSEDISWLVGSSIAGQNSEELQSGDREFVITTTGILLEDFMLGEQDVHMFDPSTRPSVAIGIYDEDLSGRLVKAMQEIAGKSNQQITVSSTEVMREIAKRLDQQGVTQELQKEMLGAVLQAANVKHTIEVIDFYAPENKSVAIELANVFENTIAQALNSHSKTIKNLETPEQIADFLEVLGDTISICLNEDLVAQASKAALAAN